MRIAVIFRRFSIPLASAILAILLLGESGIAGSGAEKSPAYEQEIRPLFETKCLRCHSAKAKKADLDLSTPAGIAQGGESGPVVVAGKPDESPLFEKVHEGEMPPGKKDRLSAAEVDTIRRWVESGAEFSSGQTAHAPPAASTITQHDVIPILLRRCTACHGLHTQEGKLDLRSKAGMLKGGKSGPAIVPGKPEASRLIARIQAGEMPPRDRLVEASVKPIEDSETETLARWIAAGAPEVQSKPDVATNAPDPLVSEKDRDFWAFRAPESPPVPAVIPQDQVRNPIDAFILQKLGQMGLGLSPEAGRAALLRRLSFDLIGLPPSPEEAAAFLADRSPDAYERLVDRLLASPHYGERWGRFWLDLAGYADSEGKREQDLPRPHAWRYRDYVVRAFNTDKPYDRFLLEQIAGDELADAEHAPEVTREIYENLVATGFLRMAPDATWANITGYLGDRVEVVADEIDVLGSAVMGLTLKCARCHTHKFDPIPQRDYYRLVAVFKGAYDEYNWLKPNVHPGIGPVSQDFVSGRLLPYVTTEERRAWESHEAAISREIEVVEAAKTDSDNSVARIKALEARRTPEPKIQALWDRGEPSPTYMSRRGDPFTPGPLVGPGVPSVLTDGKTPFAIQPPWPGAKKTGRRLAFARWLTRPGHPLTARVAVNRIWKHHFGSGIVKTLGNFGKTGSPPSHPELLDWLAREFVAQGWNVKRIHRLILTSATYRQCSAVTPDRDRLDPDNMFCSRMPLVRLDAEALYDALLSVSGRLDATLSGPPDPVQVRKDGMVTPISTDRGWRRLIYVKQMRKQTPTHLENFDYPQMNPNCVERRDSTVAPQALYLMNNAMVDELARAFGERVRREAGALPSRQVERAYAIALGRAPSEEERRIGVDALKSLEAVWAEGPDGFKSLTTYCHAILNSACFLYVD
jgi:mono/diheme cytochrome c family protein